ncbi:MAG: MobF family relaxase [Solirubrobacteraceae bacterium]
MQTTHKIPGDSAVRYARYLTSTSNRGDYYTGDGEDPSDQEVPSQWHGPEKLLKRLGLSADQTVDRDLNTVMQGFSPRDGTPLRPAGSDSTRVAAVELMYAPPKTVSALWAVSDPYHRAQIEAAHRDAVKSTLERTEREIAMVRRKTNNVVRFEKAKGVLAAEIVHTSSRLSKDQETGGIPDPQLHSHVLLFAAERQDGKLAALESKRIYQAARENGAWYRAQLAHNLKDLGLEIDRRTGKGERYFEIHGVPQDLAERWSSRSEDVDRAAKLFRQRYGRDPRAGELGSITQATRGSKSSANHVDVNKAWRAVGAEHGLTQDRAQDLFHDWGLPAPAVDLRAELLSEVTRERATINAHELHAKAYELSAGVSAPAQADELVKDLIRCGELIELEDGTWTTRELRESEQRTVAIAEQRASKDVALVTPESLEQARMEVERAINGSLTLEQREALQTITGPGGVSVLVGQAGTGKGVVISAASRAWQLEDNAVIGTALAGVRAQDLKHEANLDAAYTIDSLINKVQHGQIKLGPDTMVAVDEAAMVDTPRLEKLVTLTDRANAKILLVGDSAQINSIRAGGVFKELEWKVPTSELTQVQRANHEWERTAWEQIRAGDSAPALAQYQAHERLHIHDTRAQAAEAMVDNWDQVRRSTPDGRAVMLTDASNLERDQMNAMAQEHRAQAGELGAEKVELPGKPYGLATGDELIFTAQYYPPGQQRIENGTSGTVIHTNAREDNVTIKTQEQPPREVDIDTGKFSDLSLSYAVHAHKGQGITAETSGILIGGWQTDKEHAYVTVSRAREETQIYVSREDLGEQGLDTGAMERLAARMANSRAQEASIAKNVAQRQPRAREVFDDDVPIRDQRDAPTPEQAKDRAPDRARPTQPAARPPDILQADPNDIQVDVRQAGDTQVANTPVYNLEGTTGELMVARFGAWRNETEQGFNATVDNGQNREVRASTEPVGERDLETELRERVSQVIQHAQTREQSNTPDASTPDPDRDRSREQPAQLQPAGSQHTPDRQAQLAPAPADRSPEILEPIDERSPELVPIDPAQDRDRAIQEAIEANEQRQRDWQQGIEPDIDNGLGIE